jgi:hypothetical protein
MSKNSGLMGCETLYFGSQVPTSHSNLLPLLQFPPKWYYPCTKPQGITSHKNMIIAVPYDYAAVFGS